MPDWIPSLPLPMVIDVLFFGAILLLLQQLNGKISQKNKIVDAEVLNQFKDLLQESQTATDRFLTVIEQEVRTLQKLIRQLEEKERMMVSLLEAAEVSSEKLAHDRRPASPPPQSERNAEILTLVREGLSRETISQRTGFSNGEIELVIELDRAGRDHR